MRSGGIDDADVRVLYVADSFDGSGIRQVEECNIGFVDFLFYFSGVFSKLGSNRNQFNIVTSFKTFQNTKSGGSFTTIDEYFYFCSWRKLLSVISHCFHEYTLQSNNTQ